MNIPSRWNRYHENLLKRWAEMSKTYSIMHSLCAQYYANWHKRLGIPVVLIGGITASSIFSSNKEDSELWVYINGGLALFVTGLAGVSNFIGTAEKTTKHQNASYKYTKIAMDIDTLLSFARNERTQTPQEFIHAKKSEILEIRENVPEVLPWVMTDYLRKFEKSLTNTKSRVNKKSVHRTYIEPSYSQGPITFENAARVSPPPNSDSPERSLSQSITSADLEMGSVPHNRGSPSEIIIHNPDRRLPTPRALIRVEPPSPPRERSREGELLADFSDKFSAKMLKVNERMQNIHDHSDFSESGDESDHVETY